VNPWPFVVAAYGVTIAASAAIAWASYAAMRRAERAATQSREPM
jgi:hypothetical protein